jgi:DNA repair and recombination RAD54-like protein
MLRRLPVSKTGDQTPTSATAGGYGLISAPFKAPTSSAPKRDLALPARKRKAVSYKGQGGGKDSDSDDEGKVVKKGKFAMGNKEYGEDGVLGDMAKWCNRKFTVFTPKDRTIVFAKTLVIPSPIIS